MQVVLTLSDLSKAITLIDPKIRYELDGDKRILKVIVRQSIGDSKYEEFWTTYDGSEEYTNEQAEDFIKEAQVFMRWLSSQFVDRANIILPEDYTVKFSTSGKDGVLTLTYKNGSKHRIFI